jgi:Mg-chelatase subunit ChlD
LSDDKKKDAVAPPPTYVTFGAKKSLHARISEAPKKREQLENTFKGFINFQKVFLLPDCSGSMGGCFKLDMLKQACSTYLDNCLPANNAIGVASFPEQAFASPGTDYNHVRDLVNSLCATGGTPLGDAMHYILSEEQFTHAVIISDGDADNAEEVRTLANMFKEKRITCDCVHIGDSHGGEELLKYVAATTGGTYIKFTDVSSFGRSFAYLAPAKRGLLQQHKNPVALLGAAEVI